MQPTEARSYFKWLAHGVVGVSILGSLTRVFRSPALGANPVDLLLDLVVALAGGGLVYYGFATLREKRMLENIPSSKVRSVAMGLAEIKGAAKQKAPLVSPLTGAACTYYRFLIEEERSGSKGQKSWVTIDQGQSTQPFYVEDETGRILVDPVGAETILRQAYREIKRDGGWTSSRRRYTEWRIIPEERIFVLGTVSKTHDIAFEKKARLTERLQQLKKDKDKMREIDTNQDGDVSPEEWDAAVQKAQDDLLREEVSAGSKEAEDDVVIGKGALEETFLIADRSEKSVERALAWKAGASLSFGPVIVAAVAVSLLSRAGVLPSGWSIPWNQFFR